MLTTEVVLSTLFTLSLGQYEGEYCLLETMNQRGVCKAVEDCPYAMDLLRTRQLAPQSCGFDRTLPIVCCPQENETVVNRIGIISQQKCISNLNKNYVLAAFHGEPSLAAEFPHMAILGYGDVNDIQWLCGGSLISERFVLTAAHCLFSTQYGKVKIVRLGDLDIKNTTENAAPEDFNVSGTFRHPDYKPPSKYHDIALLLLDRTVTFGIYIRPACLYVTNVIPKEQITATGWGRTDYQGEPSSHLLKVYLNFIDYNECREAYANVPTQQLEQGIREDIQICAGDKDGRDTCPGDSGGPLQISYEDETVRRKYYQIIGVTSFGKPCGFKNSAGVYTRVSGYVAWIESIVWPGEYVLWS